MDGRDRENYYTKLPTGADAGLHARLENNQNKELTKERSRLNVLGLAGVLSLKAMTHLTCTNVGLCCLQMRHDFEETQDFHCC